VYKTQLNSKSVARNEARYKFFHGNNDDDDDDDESLVTTTGLKVRLQTMSEVVFTDITTDLHCDT